MRDMVLLLERLFSDGVDNRVMPPANRQSLHSLMDYLLSVTAGANMIYMVQIRRLTTDAALLIQKAGIQVIVDIIYEVEQREVARNIPIYKKPNKEPLESTYQ